MASQAQTAPSQAEIRLTGTSYAVLGLVQYLGQATPYELKRTIEASIDNFWPVPHTTFYAEPERLTRAGYLVEHRERGGRRRKFYEITDRGRVALREWVSDEEVSPPQLRDEGTLKVFFGADPARIYEARLRWHKAKLAELEGYLEDVSAAARGNRMLRMKGVDHEGIEGMRASLIAGTSYHRMHIEMLERFLSAGMPPR
jgi:DNA-binding PadR family transcriptional regulator